MFLGLNYSYMPFSEYAVWGKKKITTRNKFEKFVVWDMQPGVREGGNMMNQWYLVTTGFSYIYSVI